jgi:hypothetical protein
MKECDCAFSSVKIQDRSDHRREMVLAHQAARTSSVRDASAFVDIAQEFA